MNYKRKIGLYGDGIGGAVQITDDPNDPSFDPATANNRDRRIRKVIDSPDLSDWERQFLMGIYGIDRMTFKQRKRFVRIMARLNV